MGFAARFGDGDSLVWRVLCAGPVRSRCSGRSVHRRGAPQRAIGPCVCDRRSRSNRGAESGDPSLMLSLPVGLASHLSGRTLSLTVCWAVTRTDGQVLRGTAHDRDITIASGRFAGVYPSRATVYSTDIASKADGSVSNADVEGAFFSDVEELTVADIEGGFYDQAPAVLFMVNWQKPDDGQKILLS